MQTAPPRPLQEQQDTWSYAWSQPLFRIKFIVVWLLIFPLLTVFHVFFAFIEKREGIELSDWLLEQLPVHNVSLPVFLFIWGAALLAIIRCIKSPQILLLLLWSYLLVSLSRMLCIWLVPLNAPPHLIPLVDPLTNFFYGKQYVTKDLFFSGHTGLPFLAALAFWHIPQWRAFYLALTAFFGAVVLLGHYHYSIDVLAALFITHGVFQISCWLFGRDNALFRSSENQAAPRPKRASRKTADAAEGGRWRASKPFVLHIVGKESMPDDQSKPT